ncbi:MAG: gliding motility protein GldL [Saprospiraceae bacterium]|nr:gliding motility protein GldL [Saprospiraceae bacterium]MCB9308509.1 gliding motility protein GldL [Lewinellaceae bacterium]
MSFFKSPSFKYLKNLLIGLGASVVMIGALGKLNSTPWGGTWITAGLMVEAFLFAMLGILGPDKDYYWEKLYPGLDKYKSHIAPLTEGETSADHRGLNADIVENKLGGMLSELQSMSKSLGSLKALQEVDFSKTGDQLKTMNNFYNRMNEAMNSLNASVEDTKQYQAQMASLSKNLTSLNGVYGNILTAYNVKA